jgi:hypothetical protein
MISRPSGPHRGHEPSPADDEPTRSLVGDPPGPTPRDQDEQPTLLSVVRGEPTAEELAVLTAVVASLSVRRERRKVTPVGAWASYSDAHRPSFPAGLGGWRAAARFS